MQFVRKMPQHNQKRSAGLGKTVGKSGNGLVSLQMEGFPDDVGLLHRFF